MMDADAIELAIRSARAVAAFTVAGSEIAAADPYVEQAIAAARAGMRDTVIDRLEHAAAHLGQPVSLVIAALRVGKRLEGAA
jgi:hypothetical protein